MASTPSGVPRILRNEVEGEFQLKTLISVLKSEMFLIRRPSTFCGSPYLVGKSYKHSKRSGEKISPRSRGARGISVVSASFDYARSAFARRSGRFPVKSGRPLFVWPFLQLSRVFFVVLVCVAPQHFPRNPIGRHLAEMCRVV